MTHTTDPVDYIDSPEYETRFAEWLWHDADTTTVRKAQALSAGHVHPSLLNAPTEQWLAHTSQMSGRPYTVMFEHLIEVLADDFQERPGFWDDANDWASSVAESAVGNMFADAGR